MGSGHAQPAMLDMLEILLIYDIVVLAEKGPLVIFQTKQYEC